VREGQEQSENHRAYQPSDEDGAAQRRSQNDLAAPSLLGPDKALAA